MEEVGKGGSTKWRKAKVREICTTERRLRKIGCTTQRHSRKKGCTTERHSQSERVNCVTSFKSFDSKNELGYFGDVRVKTRFSGNFQTRKILNFQPQFHRSVWRLLRHYGSVYRSVQSGSSKHFRVAVL